MAKSKTPKPKQPDKKSSIPCESDPSGSFQRVADLRRQITGAEHRAAVAREDAKLKVQEVKKLRGQLDLMIDEEQEPNLFGDKKPEDGIKVNEGAEPKKAKENKRTAFNYGASASAAADWKTLSVADVATLTAKDIDKLTAAELKTLGDVAGRDATDHAGLEAILGKAGLKRFNAGLQAYLTERNAAPAEGTPKE